jgi:hypothetical protein
VGSSCKVKEAFVSSCHPFSFSFFYSKCPKSKLSLSFQNNNGLLFNLLHILHILDCCLIYPIDCMFYRLCWAFTSNMKRFGSFSGLLHKVTVVKMGGRKQPFTFQVQDEGNGGLEFCWSVIVHQHPSSTHVYACKMVCIWCCITTCKHEIQG